jgi:decaprenylphospho-beta-D-erythro-pentofuranosid-2-ulose 2-reductase
MSTNDLKTIAIFGGTSDIAYGCLLQWLEKDNLKVILIGRNRNSLKAIVDDLSIRHPFSIFEYLTLDFNQITAIKSLTSNLFKSHCVNIVLLAHGSLSDQQKCQSDLDYCESEIITNGLSTCIISESVSLAFKIQGSGTLAVIGSVAGDRGRKSNYTYGAAKSLVEKYTEGLQHRFYNTPINVILVKPGPTESKMTNHLLHTPSKLSKITDVAKIIVKGIEKNKQTIYAPRKWYVIMLIIKFLPKFIFQKLNI